MKKFFISVVLILSIVQLLAQQAKKELYCKTVIYPQYRKGTINGFKINIDYGSKDNFLLLSDSSFLNKTIKVTDLTNEMDAMCYLKSIGWEIVTINIITGSLGYANGDCIFWRKKIDE